MESVFESTAATDDVARQDAAAILPRVTSAGSLDSALRAAGFPTTLGDDSVTTTVSDGGWDFPVVLRVDLPLDRITIAMSLVRLPDAAAVDPQSLLTLMANSDASRGTHFAYDATERRIELWTTISNRGVTTAGLKTDLIRLATTAQRHSPLWSKLGESAAGQPKQKPASEPKASPPATTPPTPFSLTGRWGATMSGGSSIAIAMGADGKFKMVQVNGDQSAVSGGQFIRSGDQLTFNGDDKTTLNCQIKQTAADQFELTILGSDGKRQATLDFTKAP